MGQFGGKRKLKGIGRAKGGKRGGVNASCGNGILWHHCAFCLRRTRSENVFSEEECQGTMPEVDLSNLEVPVVFLVTLNWTWWALGRKKITEDFLDFGGALKAGDEQVERSGVQFKSVPKMCQDCGNKVLEVQSLLEKVSKEIMGLRKAIQTSAKEAIARSIQEYQNKTGITDKNSSHLGISGSCIEVPTENTHADLSMDSTKTRTSSSAISEDMVFETDSIKTEPEDNDLGGPNDYHFEVDINFSIVEPKEEYLPGRKQRDRMAKSFMGFNKYSPENFKVPRISIPGRGVKKSTTPKRKKRETTVNPTKVVKRGKSKKYKKVKYRCYECGIDYPQEKQYTAHRRGQHSTGLRRAALHRCELCKGHFPPADIFEHLKGHVGDEYILRCPNPECVYAFVTHTALRYHLNTGLICREKGSVHNLDELNKAHLSCSECGLDCSVGRSYGLRNHLINYHENAVKNFTCPVSGCLKMFSLKQTVRLHLIQHNFQKDPSTQPCTNGQCNEKLIKFEEMATHLTQEHGATEIIKCTQCPFQFLSREQLVPHMFDHRYSQLNCDICGENFINHAVLRKHYFTMHQIGKEYLCEQCPKAYLDQDSLSVHIYTAHSDNSNKKPIPTVSFQCEDCGHIAKSQDSFRNHQIQKHGAEPYGCTMCPETFRVKRALTAHIKVAHIGVTFGSFVCQEPDCGQSFKSRRHLTEHHNKIHKGRTFPCDLCGKGFASNHHMKRHVERVHLEVRKYKCDLCEEAFKDSFTMKKHRLIHTGERPFSCEICGQPFRDVGVLSRHLLSHQEKGADFKPKGPMKHARKRVKVRRRSLPVKSEVTQGVNEVAVETVECSESSGAQLIATVTTNN